MSYRKAHGTSKPSVLNTQQEQRVLGFVHHVSRSILMEASIGPMRDTTDAGNGY